MSLLHVEVADRVALVTLDDARRRNAMSLALSDEVVAAFDRLEADDDVGAVVVTGAPPAFCAGADLSELREVDAEGLRTIYRGFLRVARSTLPTLAAVNGAAVGAGANLALACDVRLAARSARIDTRFLELGLHPGGGHTWLLERAVGPQAARAMVMFGEVLDGEAAARTGLAWAVVDDDRLVDEARRLAARAASAPEPLQAAVKATFAATPGLADHDAAVGLELEPQVWSARQPWFAERLAAIRRRTSGGGR